MKNKKDKYGNIYLENGTDSITTATNGCTITVKDKDRNKTWWVF